MILQEIGHKLDASLHREDLVALGPLLFFHQSEDSIVEESIESIIEEFTDRHLLVLVLILDQLQQVFEHVVISAALNSFRHIIFGLMLLLDLADEELDLLLEEFVPVGLIVFVSWLEFNLDKICVGLEQIYESLFVCVFPPVLKRMARKLLEFLKLQLTKALISLQNVRHKFQPLGANISQMDLFDILVNVACFQDSAETIFSEVHLFKAKFINRHRRVGDESITDENACFKSETLILAQVQFRYVHGPLSGKRFFQVQSGQVS